MTDTKFSPAYPTACGGKLKDPKDYPSAIYIGKRIYFCTACCLRAFEQQPDLFMAGKVQHPVHQSDGSNL